MIKLHMELLNGKTNMLNRWNIFKKDVVSFTVIFCSWAKLFKLQTQDKLYKQMLQSLANAFKCDLPKINFFIAIQSPIKGVAANSRAKN